MTSIELLELLREFATNPNIREISRLLTEVYGSYHKYYDAWIHLKDIDVTRNDLLLDVINLWIDVMKTSEAENKQLNAKCVWLLFMLCKYADPKLILSRMLDPMIIRILTHMSINTPITTCETVVLIWKLLLKLSKSHKSAMGAHGISCADDLLVLICVQLSEVADAHVGSIETSNFVDILRFCMKCATVANDSVLLPTVSLLSKLSQEVDSQHKNDFFLADYSDVIRRLLECKDQEFRNNDVASLQIKESCYYHTIAFMRAMAFLHVHNAGDMLESGAIEQFVNDFYELAGWLQDIRSSNTVAATSPMKCHPIEMVMEELILCIATCCHHEPTRNFVCKRISVLELSNSILGAMDKKSKKHTSTRIILSGLQLYVSCHHQGIRKNIPIYFLLAIFQHCIGVIVTSVNADLEQQALQRKRNKNEVYPNADAVVDAACVSLEVCDTVVNDPEPNPRSYELSCVTHMLSIITRALDFSSLPEFQASLQLGWHALLVVVSDCYRFPIQKIEYINILCLLAGKREKCWCSPLPIYEDLIDAVTFAIDDVITSRSVRLSHMTESMVDVLQLNNPSSSFLKEVRHVALEQDLADILLGTRRRDSNSCVLQYPVSISSNGIITGSAGAAMQLADVNNCNTGILKNFIQRWSTYPLEELARKLTYISCIIRTLGASHAVDSLVNVSSLCIILIELLTQDKYGIRKIDGLVGACLCTVSSLIETHMTSLMALDMLNISGSSNYVLSLRDRSYSICSVARDGDSPTPSSAQIETVKTQKEPMLLFEKDMKTIESDILSVVGDVVIKLFMEGVPSRTSGNDNVPETVYEEAMLHTCLSTLITLAPWSKHIRRQTVTKLVAMYKIGFKHCNNDAMLFPMIRLACCLIDHFHKLESEGDGVIIALVINGLDSNNIDVRMVACEFVSLISALNPTIIHRAISRREIEDRILKFLTATLTDRMEVTNAIKNPIRVCDILRACIAIAKDINHKATWVNSPWAYHWSTAGRDLFDEKVIIPLLRDLISNFESSKEPSSIAMFALTIGFAASLMKNCVSIPQLSKLKNSLIRVIIPILPEALDLLVRSDELTSSPRVSAKLDLGTSNSNLELLAAHTINALQAFLCMPDEMFPMAVYLQNIEGFAHTPVPACVCFIMTKFRENVNIQRNCLEIIRCFVDNRLELTALGMHCPSAIMLAIRALPEERRQQCSFCVIVSTIASRDEFAKDNMLRFNVHEGLGYIIQGQQLEAAPLACQSIVDLCDTAENAKIVSKGLATTKPLKSDETTVDRKYILLANSNATNTMMALLFRMLDEKVEDIKMQVEGLRAVLALCICKDCLLELKHSPSYLNILKKSRAILMSVIRGTNTGARFGMGLSLTSSDYTKEKLQDLFNATAPMRLTQNCIIM